MSESSKFAALAELGFSVFPVVKSDKKPAVKWTKYQDKMASADDISFWDSGDFNVGVACGRISNIVVVDVDSDEAQALYESFCPPSTPVVRTQKGRHYYFRYPAIEIRNSVRINGVALDVRGQGGYVVGAGSRHPSGAVYDWEIAPADCDFAEMPDNLQRLLSGASDVSSGGKRTSLAVRLDVDENPFAAWVGNAVERGVYQIAQAQPGERNDTLNNVSFAIASQVAAAQLDWASYADKLLSAAMSIGLSEVEAKATIASAWAGGQKKPCPWMLTAKRYVYLSARGQFYNLAARLGISESAFNRTHNSERQWEKGAMAAFLTDNDLMAKAFDLRFDPTHSAGVYHYDGERYLNTYVDPAIEPVQGDASPFTDFVAHLVPNEVERDHLLKMIAWTVRNPGKKLGHALLLRTERQGVGKSMLIAIWRELLGTKNTRLTTTEEITGNYQGFIEGNLLVLVEELNVAFGMHGYNRIKNLITGDTAEVNEKFVSSRERPNHASFVFLTNLSEPILIEDSDRRFFFIDSPAIPRDPGFYADFASWWKSNIGIIRSYINDVDLSQFNPFAPPPETEAKRALQMASRTPLEQEIAEAIAERRFPFSRDIVSLREVATCISAARAIPIQRLKTVMRGLGCVSLGAHRVNGEWTSLGMRPVFVPGVASKPSLWAIRNVDFWSLASPQTRVEEFSISEGVLSIFDGTGLGIRHASLDDNLFHELSKCPSEGGAIVGLSVKYRVEYLLSSQSSKNKY